MPNVDFFYLSFLTKLVLKTTLLLSNSPAKPEIQGLAEVVRQY